MTRPRPIGPMDSMPIGGSGPAMTSAAVTDWGSGAEKGAEIVYAIGHLPVWAKGPAVMRDMAERGLVHLFCDRAPQPKHYVAVRTGKAWPAEGLVKRRIMREPPPKAPEMKRLLDVLTEYAADGLPCPPNPELARLADLANRERAKYLLGEIERAGSISRRACAEAPGRVVTIRATGQSTGLETVR